MQPDNAVYWRGLGDVLCEYYSGNVNEIPYDAGAALAYQRSVSLDKKERGCVVHALSFGNQARFVKQAEAALNRALRLDRGNAFLWYEMRLFSCPATISSGLTPPVTS